MTTWARIYKGAGVLGAITRARLGGLGGTERRMLFLDVGARNGLAPRWDLVARAGLIEPVFVEADTDEAKRLARRYRNVRLIDCAVGAEDGATGELHLTREPGRSSLLQPDLERLREFGDASGWDVVERRPLPLRRLDRVWPSGCAAPDFLKVDVQGFELPVIEGMGALFDRVRCVELEVMLSPVYVGQPSLAEVADFLMARGFDLVRLASMGLYGNRAMLEFNAYWVRRELHDDPWVRFWKAVNGVGTIQRAVTWGY
jgi:FkbM family methyltransferase